MAIDIPQELTTFASGSAGDVVASHNQHGPYTRSRTTPTDPSTAQQLAVRAALSDCVTAWNATLTESERRSWDVYALAVPTANALGRSTNPGGLAAFVRANVPRLQANEVTLPRVDRAPPLFDSGPFTPVIRVVLNVIDDTLHPFIALSDAWTTESGAALLLYASLPQPLTRNFWKGPYRYLAPLLGAAAPLASPATIPLAVAAAADERVFVHLRVTRSDARLSPPCRVPADIVPQVRPVATTAVFTPLAPPNARIDVAFDSPIRDEPHVTTNWSVRMNDFRWTITSVVTHDNAIRVFLAFNFVQVGVDTIQYRATIQDVVGLLTGIPSAPFRRIPT